MKKLLLITLMLMSFRVGYSPTVNSLIVIKLQPIKVQSTPNDWLKAIIWLESGKEQTYYNPNEPQAEGELQQYPIFVEDVNRIVGYKKYTLADRSDNKKAEEMFWIYQKYYNPEMDFEKMCRIQCGGPFGYLKDCTLNYYNTVKDHLQSSL